MKRIFLTILVVLNLAGCATTVRYTSYTDQKSPVKPKDYVVNIYPATVQLPTSRPYRVIGKLEIQGNASDGANPQMLVEQAKNIARKKGADAIINVDQQTSPYVAAYLVPGHRGYYHYHRTRVIPYQDTFLKFMGELVVFMSSSMTN